MVAILNFGSFLFSLILYNYHISAKYEISLKLAKEIHRKCHLIFFGNGSHGNQSCHVIFIIPSFILTVHCLQQSFEKLATKLKESMFLKFCVIFPNLTRALRSVDNLT